MNVKPSTSYSRWLLDHSYRTKAQCLPVQGSECLNILVDEKVRSVEEEGEQIDWELDTLDSNQKPKVKGELEKEATQGRATQSFVQLRRPEPYHYEQKVASTYSLLQNCES